MTSVRRWKYSSTKASSDKIRTLQLHLNGKKLRIVNITADQRKRVRHILDLFIVIGKRYWNNGTWELLLEEATEWGQARVAYCVVQLSVQTRNQAAQSIYHKHGALSMSIEERGGQI